MTAWTELWRVPQNLPSFDGHFPGHPILPGVVVLARAQAFAAARLEAAGVGFAGVSNVKFLRSVAPGALLGFEFRAEGNAEKINLVVREGEKVVATGVLKTKARA